MTESTEHQLDVIGRIQEIITNWFGDKDLDPSDVGECASQISRILGDRGPLESETAESVRERAETTIAPAPKLSVVKGPWASPADERVVIKESRIVTGPMRRTWRRFVPITFVLTAWFVFWLLLFGLDRRTWLVASEIAVACTVALGVTLVIWGWLEKSFGGG